jgi:transcription initiation factor IIE alpha subunit
MKMQEENSEDPKKYLCERCRKFFTFSEIKYIVKGPESKVALCTKCRQQSNVESLKVKEKPVERTPYFCGRCKYKFKFDKAAGRKLTCPYCGKDDKIVLDKISDINKLIEDSD